MFYEKKRVFLNKKIKVLDAGYVELCDYMGNDETIVRCARESYGKDQEDLTEEIINQQITSMIKNGHSSPFEQVVFQFHMRMPIFVSRQVTRHRTARMNEISGRYTKFGKNDFHIPDFDSLLLRAIPSGDKEEIKDQNAFDDIKNRSNYINEIIKNNNDNTYIIYSKMIDNNIPKELARLILPLSLYTEFYWQMDLNNLMKFLALRLEEHAQKEIREYAFKIFTFVNAICPITMSKFLEYKFNTYTLNNTQINILLNTRNTDIDNSQEELKEVIFKKYKDICNRNKLFVGRVLNEYQLYKLLERYDNEEYKGALIDIQNN